MWWFQVRDCFYDDVGASLYPPSTALAITHHYSSRFECSTFKRCPPLNVWECIVFRMDSNASPPPPPRHRKGGEQGLTVLWYQLWWTLQHRWSPIMNYLQADFEGVIDEKQLWSFLHWSPPQHNRLFTLEGRIQRLAEGIYSLQWWSVSLGFKLLI